MAIKRTLRQLPDGTWEQVTSRTHPLLSAIGFVFGCALVAGSLFHGSAAGVALLALLVGLPALGHLVRRGRAAGASPAESASLHKGKDDPPLVK